MQDLRGKDRLIVALDVPTAREAIECVERLDNVSFFKIGLQLFMTGEVFQLIEQLNQKKVFLDLKIPGDIGNTIHSVVEKCVALRVRFLTLSDSVPLSTIRAARTAKGEAQSPQLLMVPYLSSLDAEDLKDVAPSAKSLQDHIIARAINAVAAGCEGLIASGEAIRWCHDQFGDNVVIVSPGIRPAGSSSDDHKRHTTPTEAIDLGADYLVVGRPILKDPKPRDAAQRIIDEIDVARDKRRGSSGLSAPEGSPLALSARPTIQ